MSWGCFIQKGGTPKKVGTLGFPQPSCLKRKSHCSMTAEHRETQKPTKKESQKVHLNFVVWSGVFLRFSPDVRVAFLRSFLFIGFWDAQEHAGPLLSGISKPLYLGEAVVCTPIPVVSVNSVISVDHHSTPCLWLSETFQHMSNGILT